MTILNHLDNTPEVSLIASRFLYFCIFSTRTQFLNKYLFSTACETKTNGRNKTVPGSWELIIYLESQLHEGRDCISRTWNNARHMVNGQKICMGGRRGGSRDGNNMRL